MEDGMGFPQTPDSDEARWHSVMMRDVQADGRFVYAVQTTGVYCRPSCPSRTAKRQNVRFFDGPGAAEAAGYRPCRRCHPQGASPLEGITARIAQACRLIEQAEDGLSLDALATLVGLSPSHFHRQFKAITGVTPRAYGAAHRMQKVRKDLAEAQVSVTEAIYDAGFGSNSRFYEQSNQVLGMTPTAFKKGGVNAEIHFAVGACSLGAILVARSPKGICAITLGDDPQALIDDFQHQFRAATLVGGDTDFEAVVAQVVGFVDNPTLGLSLPLDVRGTAFQQRVWCALQAIPVGHTQSYREVAQAIGAPTSVRAVARACAANALAVAIPCHRVIRTDGGVSGYRWGVDRKQALLAREKGQ